MMFNKILVLTGGEAEGAGKFPLSDYRSLAKEVFANLDPSTDIHFSQGPMDVLDHSCSKLGFGGKMCIDGTIKFEEEKSDEQFPEVPASLSKTAIRQQFPEIAGINDSLLAMDISCIVVSVKKQRPGHVRELHQQLCALPDIEGVKMILYVEHTVDAEDLPVALWRFCNNADPRRDHTLVKRASQATPGRTVACMGFDGTIKTKELDNFHRDWPNIIVADDQTIRSVDAKWSELAIGPFLPSPSLKFADQVYGRDAVVSLPADELT